MFFPLNYYFYDEFPINSFNVLYLVKCITQCKISEINIFKIKICLTITNKRSSDAKINYLPFAELDKLPICRTSHFRYLSSLIVEHYVEFLS